MTKMAFLQWLVFMVLLLLAIKPLGLYMAKVYDSQWTGLRFLRFIEQGIYRLSGIRPEQGMDWKNYLASMLALNVLGILLVYLLQRIQAFLPLNPQHFPGIEPGLALNTAVSFASNTNWQAYIPEASISYLTQMLGFTVQNFISAATGMSLLIAFIRGLLNTEKTHLGNFWQDTVRGIVYILLPLAFVLALVLVSQGVIQNFKPYPVIQTLEQLSETQLLPIGPVASQVAIKQLGSNGGGFFASNAAHPFENPNPLTYFLELFAILLIPAAFCYSFGVLAKDTRQGLAILLAILIIFIPLQLASIYFEQQENPSFRELRIDQTFRPGLAPGGNMEGKETRFGIVGSALWSTATTASSNGSVNAMLDSFTPLGGMVALLLMHLGEIIFGGVGSGLYSLLLFVILTVFIAGLMVGRTPEYLGKKIEAFEMKMASFAVLVMPSMVLIVTAIAVVIPAGVEAILNPGPHGFSEILYAFSSMAANNGSAFAGLKANVAFYNEWGVWSMLLGRYWLAIPVLAIAGSLIQKKYVPMSSGTLQTHSLLFVLLMVSVILMIGLLSFFPALVLGPLLEHLQWRAL